MCTRVTRVTLKRTVWAKRLVFVFTESDCMAETLAIKTSLSFWNKRIEIKDSTVQNYLFRNDIRIKHKLERSWESFFAVFRSSEQPLDFDWSCPIAVERVWAQILDNLLFFNVWFINPTQYPSNKNLWFRDVSFPVLINKNTQRIRLAIYNEFVSNFEIYKVDRKFEITLARNTLTIWPAFGEDCFATSSQS